MYKTKSTKSKNKKLPLILALALLLLGLLILENRGVTNFFGKEDVALNQEEEAKTTSLAPTAQADFTDGDDRSVGESNQDKGQASVSDTQGNVGQVPDQSLWNTSSSGQITSYSPSKNMILENGDVISGESSLQSVSFRIIDNVSGVISEGQLSVVAGKFSGKLSFSTTASEGRLDIYGTLSDGTEISNIEIPVLFK